MDAIKRKFLKNEDAAAAWAWAVVIIMLISMAILVSVLYPTLITVKQAMTDTMNITIHDANNSTDVKIVLRSYDRIVSIFEWVIIIMLGGLITWAIVITVLRETIGGPGGPF